MVDAAGKSKKLLGDQGERLAAAYLQERGYKILSRNYRARGAEIDLICEDESSKRADDGDLVFVEVKTRTSRSHGDPLEAVTPAKLSHIKRAAECYLFEQDIEDRMCRVDVIGISMVAGIPKIEHMRDVLDY